MSDFVSKMPMHSQETPQAIIEQERSIVAAELGLTTPHAQERITFSDEGWSSRVYMLDQGEIVYKFPRTHEVIADYRREIAALTLLDTTDTPLPVQRFRATGRDDGYFSYRGIVGTQLSEQLSRLDPDTKSAIGAQLGVFLRYLHGLKLPEAPVISLNDEIKESQAKYKLALPAIEAELDHQEQAAAAEFFREELPAEITRLGAETRLCHGDLGTYNIVMTADGQPGIIDFGNIGYYDQSKDFIDFGDEALLGAALESYGTSSTLEQKVAVRTIALQAIDLVYYMSKRDTESVTQTANRLRSLLHDRQNNTETYLE